jgi:CRISPR-associated protein Csb2
MPAVVAVAENLQQDTGKLQKQGWSEPPGTQWLVYRRPSPLLGLRPIRKPTPRGGSSFARYAIQSAVQPLLTDAIHVAERMRVALVSHADGRGDHALRLFSGHDTAGRPLTGNRHAYYLPADDDGDGRIDHVVVWAPGEFDTGAREALMAVKRLWGREGHDLNLALIGLGGPEQYGTGRGGTRVVGPANIWESRTPFVLPRHPKLRRGAWIDAPEDQLRRLLSELGLSPEHIERIDATTNRGRPLEWFRFRRMRTSGKGSKGSHRGFGFSLHFAEPVIGPIAVGYGAHMGLGQFIAVS